MPAMPEIGQYPSMPEMPAIERPTMPRFSGSRGPERDAHRAKVREESSARRAAMRDMNERRRAMRRFGPHFVSYAPVMPQGIMPPAMDCQQAAPAPEQTAAATIEVPESAPAAPTAVQ
jgi:hypothetical protein